MMIGAFNYSCGIFWKQISVFIVSLAILSCSSVLEEDCLYGRYVWSDARIDTLEIRKDGSYEYWTFKPGQKIAKSGKWNYNLNSGSLEFEKEYFPFLVNHQDNGSWITSVDTKDGTIIISSEETGPLYLRKIQDIND